MLNNFALPKKEIADFCKRHYIKKLSIFGSVANGSAKPQSDLDVLVEFEEGHVPGFAFFELQDELSAIVGRKVDLNTPSFLSRYFRNDVMEKAVLQYAA